MALVIHADRRLVPENEPSTRRLLVQIVAPEAEANAERTPLNLALVLDRSTSMGGEKIELARQGALRAVRSLRNGDHLSVVAYDNVIETLIAHTPVTPESRQAAEKALLSLYSRGSTALCEGWLTGCAEAAKGIGGQAITRCLLLTDGQANQGIVDPAVIEKHAGELRARGVTTSTLGVGNDFDETLLRRMAETGGGSFYFADSATQLAEMLAGEVGENLQVVAREVELQIAFPPGTSVHCVNGLPQRMEKGRLILSLGTLVSSQFMELLFELKLPATPRDHHLSFDFGLQDSESRLSQGSSLAWQSVPVALAQAEEQNEKVALAAAENISASARQSAMAAGREQRFDEARKLLADAAGRILEELPHSAAINTITAALITEAGKIQDYNQVEYKKASYDSYKRRYSRSEDGLSWKVADHCGIDVFDYENGHHPHQGPEIFSALLFPGFDEIIPALEAAVSALHRSQPKANFLIQPTMHLYPEGWHEMRIGHAISAMKSVPGAVKIAFVPFRLRNNWYSNYFAGERAALVSLEGWEQASIVPQEAFIAHHIVLHGLRQRLKGFDTFALLHNETRGCWGDFCQFKPELEIKLQTGHICDSCAASLVAAGLDMNELMPMVDAVRELAVQPVRQV